MAAPFEIILDVDRDKQDLHNMADEAFEIVKALERQFSAYIPSSDIGYINRTAPHHPARIEPNVFRLLKLAQRIHRETGGAFDITAGPLIKVWGFYKREGRMPDEDELKKARAKVGMQYVILDEEELTVFFDRPGIEINLGGIGKGYVVDRVIAQLREWGVKTAMVHSGNSSIACIGRPPVGEGWYVGVADPRDNEKALGLLTLEDNAVSISGSTEQFFKLGDQTYSHILNPLTGWPAQGILETAAIGPSAAETDALATAFFVMGLEKVKKFCEERREIAAVLITGDAPAQFEVHTFDCTLESEGMEHGPRQEETKS